MQISRTQNSHLQNTSPPPRKSVKPCYNGSFGARQVITHARSSHPKLQPLKNDLARIIKKYPAKKVEVRGAVLVSKNNKQAVIETTLDYPKRFKTAEDGFLAEVETLIKKYSKMMQHETREIPKRNNPLVNFFRNVFGNRNKKA